MKHPHYDCIVAWAEGKDVQWRASSDKEWVNLFPASRSQCAPVFDKSYKYRIKPEPKKFRVWEDSAGIFWVTKDFKENKTESNGSFKRWITDWIEYD